MCSLVASRSLPLTVVFWTVILHGVAGHASRRELKAHVDSATTDVNQHECVHHKLTVPKADGTHSTRVSYADVDRATLKKRQIEEWNHLLDVRRGKDVDADFLHTSSRKLQDDSTDGSADAVTGNVLSGLRIVYDFSNLAVDGDAPSAEDVSYLQLDLLPQAATWLKSALRIVPVQGNFHIDRWCMLSDGTNCYEFLPDDEYTCGDHAHNSDYMQESVVCNFVTGDCSVETEAGTGVDGDILIYVTAEDTSICTSSTSTIAYAAPCTFDQQGRPLSGYINFCPLMIQRGTDAWSEQLSVAIHEIMHVLGFTSSLYDSFIDENGDVRSEDEVVSTFEERGRTVSKVVLPTVTQHAATHFACEDLNGVELEDGGGDGTAGSHWEKRIFGNEIMTGTSSNEPIYSDITLAFFEDMGWYFPDYSAAQPLSIGQNRGCSFATDVCVPEGTLSSEDAIFNGHFCSGSASGCTADSLYWAICSVSTWSSLPESFQYFADSDTVGGSSSNADYCPTLTEYTFNGLLTKCTDSDTQDSDWAPFLGEYYGADSRCFESDVTATSQSFSYNGRCYKTNCVEGEDTIILQVEVYDTWHDCPEEGGEIEINTSTDGGQNLVGTVTCPPIAETAICQGVCLNSCSGHGACIGNVCHCSPGYDGEDCSEAACPNDCSSHGVCTETTDGHFFCMCDEGFTLDDCSLAIECGEDGDWPLTAVNTVVEMDCVLPAEGLQTRFCDMDGNWMDVDVSDCVVPDCERDGLWESTAPGDIAIRTCTTTDGADGFYTRLCDENGEWSTFTTCVEVLFTCPADGDWAEADGQSTQTLPCPTGSFGIRRRFCEFEGNWADEEDGCYDPCGARDSCEQCAGVAAGHGDDVYFCRWCASTASCANDIHFNMTCDGSAVSWIDQCAEDGDGCGVDKIWPAATAGSTVSVTCPSPWVGTLTRTCGDDGRWERPPNERSQCHDSNEENCPSEGGYPETERGNTATRLCPSGTVGSVTRLCNASGIWEAADVSACTAAEGDPCPADGIWPQTVAAAWVSLECPIHNDTTANLYKTSGAPKRFCDQFGVWGEETGECFDPCAFRRFSNCRECTYTDGCAWCDSTQTCSHADIAWCPSTEPLVTEYAECTVLESAFECSEDYKVHFRDVAKSLSSTCRHGGCSIDCKKNVQIAYANSTSFLACAHEDPCRIHLLETLSTLEACFVEDPDQAECGDFDTFVASNIEILQTCPPMNEICTDAYPDVSETCADTIANYLQDDDYVQCLMTYPCRVPRVLGVINAVRLGCDGVSVEPSSCDVERLEYDVAVSSLNDLTDHCSERALQTVQTVQSFLSSGHSNCSFNVVERNQLKGALWTAVAEIHETCGFVDHCLVAPPNCTNLAYGECSQECSDQLSDPTRQLCGEMYGILQAYDPQSYEIASTPFYTFASDLQGYCVCQSNFTALSISQSAACQEEWSLAADALSTDGSVTVLTADGSVEVESVSCSKECSESLKETETCSVGIIAVAEALGLHPETTETWHQMVDNCGLVSATTNTGIPIGVSDAITSTSGAGGKMSLGTIVCVQLSGFVALVLWSLPL